MFQILPSFLEKSTKDILILNILAEAKNKDFCPEVVEEELAKTMRDLQKLSLLEKYKVTFIEVVNMPANVCYNHIVLN